MFKLAIALLCAASVACAADGIQVEREGSLWRVRLTGTLPAVHRIVADSELKVRGKASNATRYVISARVNAANEAQARQFARTFATIRLAGDAIVFTGPGNVDLEVPRKTRFLNLASEEGGIDVADLEGSVLAQTVAGRIALDRISGDVEIRSNGGSTALGRIGGIVKCYSGGGSIRAIHISGQAFFETHGGDIVLGEVAGAIRAFTGGGGIQIDQAGGSVFAGTSGGPIIVLRALGMVFAQNAAGPIDIGAASSVECQSGGGTIRLSNVSGPMRASTGRGSVIAEVISRKITQGQRLEDSFLSTGAGDISVLLPSDMGVTVDAEMSGTQAVGAIVSDYPGLRSVTGRTSVTARGAINGGGPTLRLRASGGRIKIRKK